MRKLAFVCAALVLAVAAAVWWLKLVTWEAHTGYFGPAFSHDGRHVYAVVRETSGFTWGLGWEHFTPPAYAYPMSDRIRLVRVDTASGTEETLETWATTPVHQRIISEYRGRVFNTFHATVRPDARSGVQYEAKMALPVAPASEVHVLTGTWSPHAADRRRGDWQRAHRVMGPSEPVVSGETEVFALKGPESYPCAIALLDHEVMKARVLAQSAVCTRRYPEGPPVAALLEVSRKKDIERVAELERVRAALVAKHRERGATEIEALLRTTRDLEDLGYLPKSPRIVAHRLSANDADANRGLPLFSIAEAEMASGIFPDIAKALAAPGTEINKTIGRYMLHDTYANSHALNAHLASGGREFLVRYRGETWRIELRYVR